jgi:hypothetical protein
MSLRIRFLQVTPIVLSLTFGIQVQDKESCSNATGSTKSFAIFFAEAERFPPATRSRIYQLALAKEARPISTMGRGRAVYGPRV